MKILDFGKPQKVLPTEVHNRMYRSSARAAGTYVPNMSTEDRMKWKAKKISGKDPRVEIRKTVTGTDPTLKSVQMGFSPQRVSSQILVIVRSDKVVMSANGRVVFDNKTWSELQLVVQEAKEILDE